MLRYLQVTLGIGLALMILVGAHYYIWARLIRDQGLGGPWRQMATVALVGLGLCLPASFILHRVLDPRIARGILWPIFVWMGLMLLLVFALAAADLARQVYVFGAGAAGRPLDEARRGLLRRALSLAALAAAGGLSMIAVWTARGPLRVRKVRVPLTRLSPQMNGTTIVQLCDLHLGPTLRREFVEQVVEAVNRLRPDLIVIIGDLVDDPVAELHDVTAPLAGLKSRYGVFFVTGNHEYYISRDGARGADEWTAELGRLGIRVLRNQRVGIGEGDEGFDLAGIDDWSARGRGHGMDLPAALDGRDERRELVLLAHQPRAIFQAARRGVGLQLSGHTHGGQIWPWRYLVYLQQPYVSGLAKHGPSHIYVSDGTGFWGPPMRLGTAAEITHITLVRA